MAPKMFYTKFLGYSPEEADAIVESASTSKTKEVWKKPEPKVLAGGKPQGGGRKGKPPRQSPGRPAQRTPKA